MAKLSLIKLFLILVALIFVSSPAHALTSEYFSSESFPMVLEMGFQYLHPDFTPIDNVVVRNSHTSNVGGPEKGGVNQNYPDVFAQIIRAKILLNEAKKANLTLQSFLPLNSLAQVDSGNTYLPEYVLYRTENQRPRMSAMGEMNLSDDWRAGLGLDLGFGVTSEATVFLQSGAGNYSDQRISASVKPKIIPMGSVEFEGYRLLIKAENKVNFTLNTSTGASVFVGNAGFDITYATSSAMFFDPWTFDLSRRYSFDGWTITPGISYQLWSRFEARAAVINNVSGTFSNGRAPSFQSKNLLVPRIAIEKTFGVRRWELSYEYKDSIFKDTPGTNGNYLDPPRHAFALATIFPFSSGWELGASLQVSRLAPQSVLKSDVTEIGAPGYRAAGWVYGGNVSLIVPFETRKL